MDTKDIIIKYLNENGFDGLFNFDAPCGCLATDLAPCGNLSSDCKPGYKIICKPKTVMVAFVIVAVPPMAKNGGLRDIRRRDEISSDNH